LVSRDVKQKLLENIRILEAMTKEERNSGQQIPEERLQEIATIANVRMEIIRELLSTTQQFGVAVLAASKSYPSR
jgi:signal recognition particle GTPase